MLLIDELDLHLHPIWQRQLREFLDSKLPNFQILATTHSPLTAQQCAEGELYFLRRPHPQAPPILEPFRGSPRTLLLHQLVLSPQFGLETVDSHSVEGLKHEYRVFKELKSPTKPQKDRLSAIASQLKTLPDWFEPAARSSRPSSSTGKGNSRRRTKHVKRKK